MAYIVRCRVTGSVAVFEIGGEGLEREAADSAHEWGRTHTAKHGHPVDVLKVTATHIHPENGKLAALRKFAEALAVARLEPEGPPREEALVRALKLKPRFRSPDLVLQASRE